MAGFRDSQAGLVVGLVGGSHVVNHMYYLLLPPAATAGLLGDLDVTGAEIGLAIGVLGLVVTGLQLPFGHLSDTRGRTLMLAISLGFGAVGTALTATATSFAWLLVAQLVTGVGIAGHHPAHYPLLSAATDPGTRGRAFSVHGFTGAMGFALPPAVVAGAATLGYDWRVAIGAIALVGALYGVFAIAVLHYRVDDAITAATAPAAAEADWTLDRVRRLPRRAAGGLGRLVSSRGIVLLTVLWFLTSMAAWGVKTQTIPLLSNTYGLSGEAASLLTSAMFVVGALLMFGGGWLSDRASPGPVLAAGYVAFVVASLALASGLLPVVIVVGVTLLFAATLDYSRPARAALADTFSSADSLGKNFGLLTVGISGGSAVAPPVLGVVSDVAGERTALFTMAGLGVLCLALTAVVVRVGGADPVGRPQPGDD